MTLPITCPACEDTCTVTAPDDACVFFHRCECCGALLRPSDEDCCVICSFGAQVCPPRRAERDAPRS